jgi:hypothetical protein
MKIQSTLLASALYSCLLPFSAAHAMISDDSCSSDADCPADTYCALVTTQSCAPDFDGADCLAPEQPESVGQCEPLPVEVSCEFDEDCGEGFRCEFPGGACEVICAEDGECFEECLPSSPEGICIEDDVIEIFECESDADCGNNEHCEWVEWMLPSDDDENDAPAWGGGGFCVANTDLEGECWRDWDCGPGYRCEGFYDESCVHGEDGVYHCEEVEFAGTCVRATDPEPTYECLADEDCGEGGTCLYNIYYLDDCPADADCMIPPGYEQGGYCAYDDIIIDDEAPADCVIRVHDECVLYADEGAGLSCEATGAGPTWLAGLAILSLIRRRKSLR